MMNEDNPLTSTLISDIFTEFANITRCNILIFLKNIPSSAPNLAKKYDLPIQEIHRQINRLQEVNLIKKNDENKFELTTTGLLAVSNIAFFEILYQHKRYFDSHGFGDLPDYLVQQIGVLKNAELKKGIGTSIETYKQIVNESTSILRVMIPQIVLDANEEVLKNAKKGMKVEYLYGQNTIIPDGNEKIETKYGLKKMLQSETVKQRRIKHIFCTVVITDKQAMLFLPDDSGDSDINFFFIGDDKEFWQWCVDVFNYYWNLGAPFE